MEYLPQVNLLLEALAYLGRRAAGNTPQRLLERLCSNGVTELESFRQRLEPMARLMEELEAAVPMEPEILEALFGNLQGFPYNTIGSSSPVFLLLYGEVDRFRGNLGAILKEVLESSPEVLAGNLAQALDVADEGRSSGPMSREEFSARVLDLSIPAESKVAILELHRRPGDVLAPAEPVLRKVLECLKKAPLEEICRPFTRELEELGPEHFIAQTSGLSSRPELQYVLRPFLFGMDTNLSTQNAGEQVQVYCGILRRPIQAMLSSTRGPEYQVYNAIKLLGDKTRFDILCYLKDKKAYGQELSTRFNLSRNTIHHHMSKLLAARLVTCTVDGNRVYYAIDRDSVSDLLDRQRELLL